MLLETGAVKRSSHQPAPVGVREIADENEGTKRFTILYGTGLRYRGRQVGMRILMPRPGSFIRGGAEVQRRTA